MLLDERLKLFNKIANNLKCYDIGFLKNFYYAQKQNYSPEQIKALWRKGLVNVKDSAKNLNLYINIPFCLGKCKYCRHPSYNFNKKLLNIYLVHLFKTIDFYSDTFRHISFNTLYLGGGTPSILTSAQIKLLFSRIYKNFKLKKGAIITFECNPNTITLEKLRLLKSFGVNRISLGVQSLDAKVLKAANRLNQSSSDVKTAILNAKRCRFDYVNVDLMLGLKYSNKENVLSSCKEILKMKPATVYIYKYKPEFMHFGNYIYEKPEIYFEKSKLLSREVFEVLNRMKIVKDQYEVSENDNCLSLKAKRFSGLDYEKLQTDAGNSSVLGLGQFAMSWLYNNFYCKEENNNFVFNKNRQYLAGSVLSGKYEISRYIFYSLENNNSAINKKEFKRKFNQEIEKIFAKELEYLQEKGKIKIDDKLIHFIPRDSKERLIYSMFFLDQNIFNDPQYKLK